MKLDRANVPLTDGNLYAIFDSILPLIHNAGSISAGFPSPAGDYLEEQIDLTKELVRNPDATFIVRVDGQSMRDDGIEHGDILIVDRSITPVDGVVAVFCLNGAFTVKRLEKRGKQIRLIPANPDYDAIEPVEGDHIIAWGTVTYIIKKPS